MNMEGRIRRIEMKVFADAGISKDNKLIVIPYRTEDEFTRLKQARMDELRRKYGPNVSEKDVLIIRLRKYGPKE
jgi:hypothetical protein